MAPMRSTCNAPASRAMALTLGFLLLHALGLSQAQRMTVFSSPYAIRLDEEKPPKDCLEVGWCRDALAYLPPSSFVRWCGWARTRCIAVTASSDNKNIPIEVDVMTQDTYSFWAGRNLNYTVKNNITTIRDMSCRSAACKKSYGPYPGLLSNETYCVIIARAPNATLPKSNRTGTNASDPDLLTVRYRVRTDCSGASAASMALSLLLVVLSAALLLGW